MTIVSMQHHPADFLTVGQLTEEEFAHLMHLAASMKHCGPERWTAEFPGQMISCYFEKPSPRTRASFAGAAARLGMTSPWLQPDELQLGRGEPIADTARVLASYSAAIVVRTFDQHVLEQIAVASDVPVVNALTDQHHPCQALADFLTLRERFGRLEGLRLAYIGDSDNVAHSLMEAGALTGVEIVVASRHGSHVSMVEDPREAVAGADAVYTDGWVSMGAEVQSQRRLAALERYRVTPELMALAKPEAIFLHCLPAHRGQEVDAAVIDGPQSAVWQQAANRMPTQEALLRSLIRNSWMPESA